MAANMGVAPPDFTTDIGKVRSLLQDTDPKNITGGQGEYLWQSDDEIAALLEVRGDGPRKTSIYIWRMIAMTPAMQLKKWSSADLALDGPAISREIREIIDDIEKADNAADANAASEFFQIVDTGAAVAQPALYPAYPLSYLGRSIDPTVPFL